MKLTILKDSSSKVKNSEDDVIFVKVGEVVEISESDIEKIEKNLEGQRRRNRLKSRKEKQEGEKEKDELGEEAKKEGIRVDSMNNGNGKEKKKIQKKN